MRDGTADIAIAGWVGSEPDGLTVSVVFDDALVVVVARDHPWAGRRSVRPAELARAELITLPRGTGARAALDALMARTGRSAIPRWEVSTPAFVEMLTTRGLGIGIVSETTMEHWHDVIPIRIDDSAARSRLGLLWRRTPSHATRALLRELLPDSPGQ